MAVSDPIPIPKQPNRRGIDDFGDDFIGYETYEFNYIFFIMYTKKK